MTGRREFILGGATLALSGCMQGQLPTALSREGTPTALKPSDFSLVLGGLEHAEGAATTPDGRLFFSSAGGVIGLQEPDGKVSHIGQPLMPTGVAIDRQGRILVANMGLLNNGPGPLQRVDATTGLVETLVSEIDGRQLAASNFPVATRDGFTYCSHSSWGPVANIGTTQPAGFIYMVAPDDSASLAVPQLRGVNGLCVDKDERYLYAALTAEGRIMRWKRQSDGRLTDAEYYGPQLGRVVPDQQVRDILAMSDADKATLGYCDGIAFDTAGNLWITLPFSNKLVAITPAGGLVEILHDPAGDVISMPTNLCWGGSDRRDLYIVSRRSGTITKARTDATGIPLANWPRG